MTKKERLQAKYDKMLLDFDNGHRKLKDLKDQMRRIREEIKSAPNIIDERPDEWQIKEQ